MDTYLEANEMAVMVHQFKKAKNITRRAKKEQ